MDFDKLQVSLPEPKRIKAKYLMAEATLQRGCRSIPLKLLRELAGSAQYWSVVCPELKPYLPILYSLMHVPSGAEDKWATPRPGEDPELLWEEFWDALDFIRLQLERPVRSSFNASFEKLLPIRELLALPGMASRSRMVGGDATLGRFGAVDWKAQRFMVSETENFADALKEVLPDSDQVEIIAIMELLAFIVFATQEGSGWGGEVVFYVTDNQNVQTWLAKRRPKVRAAFRCVPVYIRTYRNQLADWVSREEISRVRAELLEAGWWESVFQEDWSQLIEDARFGPLTLPGERGDSWLDSSWLMGLAPVSRRESGFSTHGKLCITAPRVRRQRCRPWFVMVTRLPVLASTFGLQSHKTREEPSLLEPWKRLTGREPTAD